VGEGLFTPQAVGLAVIVDPAVERYLHRIQQPGDAVLEEMGDVGEERGFPIIGPLVGRLCEQLARGIGAKTVFEMGSGFGYSTAWFARAVGPSGRVVHTEMDEGLQGEAKEWLRKAGATKQVDFRLGDASELLKKDKGPYDVVFIDIDKEDYPKAWKLARDRVRVGGLIVTDNTLWHGKVAGTAKDAATEAVREYNRLSQADQSYLTTLMPVRDGVAISLRLK
jgi:predicted O-methyltransferase YrrM